MMRAVQLMYEGWIDVWYWMSWCLIVVIWLAIIDSAIGMAVGQALAAIVG